MKNIHASFGLVILFHVPKENRNIRIVKQYIAIVIYDLNNPG